MFAAKNELFTRPSGYTISRSVRLRSSASAYLNRTPASAGTGAGRIWTWSAWVKRGTVGSSNLISLMQGQTSGASSDRGGFGFYAYSGGGVGSDSLTLYYGAAFANSLTTTQVFRDPSAWYHIVYAVDTTQATASNRVKLYVNGVQVTSFSASNYPTLNYQFAIGNNVAQWLGSESGTNYYFDGYLTEINFIDGQALTPTSFGQFNSVTGVWQPIKYTGTYGNNGFYLNFSDNSNNTATTIGKDYSGNGNNWTPNNISVTSGVTYDSMIDVPTVSATGSNYCVLNGASIGTDATLSNANLTIAYGSGTTRNATMGTFGMSSGKWYFEATVTASSISACTACIGITNEPSSSAVSNYPGFAANGWGYDGNQGFKYNNGSGVAYGATYGVNDVVGVAFDADAGTLTFYKNNVSQGTAYTGLASGTYFPSIGDGSGANTFTVAFNFGQRPFTYTPPSGYVALNTFNLPAPTISNGALYMAATTYTGTGASNTISNGNNNTIGTTFKPDLVWIKSRSAATDHKLTDSVRGTTKALISDTTGAETTDANGLTAFGNTGFTVGSDTTYNNNTATYVGWQWQAGAGTTSSNTSGSITSTVSVNATAGFSVVTYTGIAGNVAKTFGHGLGVAPSMVIIKPRTTASAFNAWVVWHSAFTGSEYIYLDLTNAKATSANYWGATVPSSTVVTVGGNSSNVSNESGINYVAYCFSAVTGYSAFGSYTGNGSSDGPFVYLGFRPRFVMIKRTDAIGDWYVFDTGRDSYNATTNGLIPNSSGTDTSYTGWGDILSNGFKIRRTDGAWNASGGTYVYACFAENPYKLALAR